MKARTNAAVALAAASARAFPAPEAGRADEHRARAFPAPRKTDTNVRKLTIKVARGKYSEVL